MLLSGCFLTLSNRLRQAPSHEKYTSRTPRAGNTMASKHRAGQRAASSFDALTTWTSNYYRRPTSASQKHLSDLICRHKAWDPTYEQSIVITFFVRLTSPEGTSQPRVTASLTEHLPLSVTWRAFRTFVTASNKHPRSGALLSHRDTEALRRRQQNQYVHTFTKRQTLPPCRSNGATTTSTSPTTVCQTIFAIACFRILLSSGETIRLGSHSDQSRMVPPRLVRLPTSIRLPTSMDPPT